MREADAGAESANTAALGGNIGKMVRGGYA